MTKTVVKENGKKDIVKTYSYNQNGAMISEREEGGISKAYTYDNRNRKISETTSGTGLSSATTTTSYGYDTDIRIHDGRSVRTEPFTFVETTTSPLGNTTSAYINGTGNTLKEVAGDTYVDYTYDKSGNTVVTYTGTSKSNDYELSLVLYNEEGKQFAQISQPDIRNDAYIVGKDSVVTYTEYDGKGNLTREIDGEGNAVSYTYDDEGRLSACDVADDGNDITAAYSTEDDDAIVTTVTDARGNQKVEKTNQAGLTILVRDTDTDADVSIQTTYEYDSYGRLAQSIRTDHKKSDAESRTVYSYDAVGNRISMTENGKTTEYTYNGLNQLTETNTPESEILYTYDRCGNQIKEENTTENTVKESVYSVNGEMLSQQTKSGKTVLSSQENAYNQEGIRISRKEGNVLRRYYYDNGLLAYTKDGVTISSANILGTDGNIIGTYRGKTYHQYLKDVQGSTSSIVKEDGSLSAAYAYSDFGETTELTGGGFDNEICYTGGIYDQNTGLYYLNARYYDPTTGRFISQDSYRGEMSEPGQWHLYAYCANDPINYVDPSGHDAIVLKSNFVSEYVGHMAVLIQSNGNWKYFSWANKGYRSDYIGEKANVKVKNKVYTSVKNKKVYTAINNRFKRKKASSKYTQYIYIKGNFSGSADYINKVKSGRSYRTYDLTGINCAWMALETLRHGNLSSKKRNAIKAMQWKKAWVAHRKQYVTKVRTIIPNRALGDLAQIFGVSIKNVSRE